MPATTNPPEFPAILAAQPARRAERELFEALKRQLPSNVFVYHGWRWYKRDGAERPLEGEGDFVILWPSRGVLVIEVKGGEIQRDAAGNWLSKDAGGSVHAIKDPFMQVAQNAEELAQRLGGVQELRVSAPTVCWAVAFPAAHGMPPGIDVPAERVVLADHMAALESRIVAILDHWSETCRSRWQSLTKDAAEACRGVLRPEISFADNRLLGEQIDELEHDLSALLTEQQRTLLRVLEDNARVRMRGSAGTGKTVMAKTLAQLRAAAGDRVLLLCHNRLLGESLEAWAKKVPNVIARHFSHYAHGLLDATNRFPSVPERSDGDEAVREFWNAEVPTAVLDYLGSAEGARERYDTILIDEAQDFSPDTLAAIECLARNDASFLHTFYDDNQNTYKRSANDLKRIGTTLVTLTQNLRNTRRIVELGRRVLSAVEMTPNGVVGPLPIFIEASEKQQAARVQSLVRELVKDEGVAPERIAILTGNRKPAGLGFSESERSQWDSLRSPAASLAEGVFTARIDVAKGLEWPVVVLCDLEGLEEKNPEAVFVGVTRAQTMLYVVGSREMRGWFGG